MNSFNYISSSSSYSVPFPLTFVLSAGALTATLKAVKNLSNTFFGSDEIKSRLENLSQSDSNYPVKKWIQLFVGTSPLSKRVFDLGQGLIHLALALTFIHALGSMNYFNNLSANHKQLSTSTGIVK